MKKFNILHSRLTFLAKIALFGLCAAIPFIGSADDLSLKLFDSEGHLSAPLQQILALTETPHEDNIASVVTETQKKWLRAPGKERWQIEELFADKKDQLIPLFRELGCFTESTPQLPSYDYAVILGATAGVVQVRINHLQELWEKGIQFKSIVFLTGDRKIDHGFESVPDNIHSETEMMKWLFKTLPLSRKLTDLPTVWIDVPEINGRRPNTADTIRFWLAEKPNPGSCLFFSTLPFVGYQDAVIRTDMPEGFYIETIGKETHKNMPIAVQLDNLARWIFQTQQLRNRSDIKK